LMWKIVEENDHLYYTFAKPPEGMSLIEDISYIEDESKEHQLDLARPFDYDGILPVIVHVHGGGWVSGDKDSYYRYYGMELSRHGFAVLTVNYRLAFNHPFPAQIEDLNAVLIWIEKHAIEYDLDPSHVYLVGDSAGAHLCALLANTLLNADLYEKFPIKKPAIVIRALGLNCGVYDLERLLSSEVDFPQLKLTVETLFDRVDYMSHPLFSYSSVSANLQENFPPSYLMTSECDTLNVETLALADELEDMGITHELRIMPEELNLGHVFHLKLNIPESLEVMYDMVRFFKRIN
jgi:acetyl esterase/lipase